MVPARAIAAADFDSAFAGESAFLTLGPGGSGTFTVFFLNTGSVSWLKGSATQVDLAACRADQVTCDSREATLAPLNPGSWLGTGRYASQTQSTVAPGAIATFTYAVSVPGAQSAGRYRFNGDLVVSVTGRAVHPEGYYQDLTIEAANCAPAIVTAIPTYAAVQVGREHVQQISATCADGKTKALNTPITASVPSENVAGNPILTLTATTDSAGTATVRWTRSNPSTERVTIKPTGYPSVLGYSTVRWVVPDVVISCSPTGAATQAGGTTRVYTVSAKSPSTGAAWSGAVALTVASYIGTGSSLTLGGANAVDKSAGTTIASVSTTTGTLNFAVGGTRGTIKPRVFLDENSSSSLDSTEFSADCGETTLTSP